MFEGLTDEQRRTLLLMVYYEKIRRENGQYGYRALKCSLDEVTEEHFTSPLVKQFDTVRRWLEARGWKVGESYLSWKGYVKYAFSKFSPTVPMPGQLCNETLLKRYITSFAGTPPKPRSPETLENIYRRVLRKEIVDHPGLMARLGLSNIEQRQDNP